jgi:mRNA-degrading endonuclease RelE of RelBE toxin-antitoxin system
MQQYAVVIPCKLTVVYSVTMIMVNMGRRPFDLIYPPLLKQHLRAIEPKYHSLIRAAIEAQLQGEPDKETRNRKPLKRGEFAGATWEIRFGPGNRFRVLYRVKRSEMRVMILAIAEKRGSRLYIGGEEIAI